MVKRDVIRKVFEAQSILNRNCRKNGYSPSDFTDKEYNQEVFKIINDKKYRREMLIDNQG
jgi:hypothetical protein